MISVFLIWNVEVAYIVPRNVTIPFTYQFVFRMLHFLRCIIVYLRRDDEGVSSSTHKLTVYNTELVVCPTIDSIKKFRFQLVASKVTIEWLKIMYYSKKNLELKLKWRQSRVNFSMLLRDLLPLLFCKRHFYMSS